LDDVAVSARKFLTPLEGLSTVNLLEVIMERLNGMTIFEVSAG
jgi:hypothetical protein